MAARALTHGFNHVENLLALVLYLRFERNSAEGGQADGTVFLVLDRAPCSCPHIQTTSRRVTGNLGRECNALGN